MEHYLTKYCMEQQRAHFKEAGKPSRGWVEGFILCRKYLQTRCMQLIKEKGVQVILPSRVSEHISRTIAMSKHFGIKDPAQVVNLDECGAIFEKMARKSLRRGVSHENNPASLILSSIRTKGNLNHVTFMDVFGTDGTAYKPVVVFPGEQPHYRRLGDGLTQTVHDFLPPCYLYHLDPAGVDSKIFLDWAKKFIRDTADVRANGRFMALVMDSLSSHLQPEVLSLFRENRVVCIALPAHSSHRLQPLDLSVFAPYKAALQAGIHSMSLHRRFLDVVAVAEVIAAAYGSSVTYPKIFKSF